MTPETHSAHASSHPSAQEPEEFHGPAVVLRGVVTLVVFAFAIFWSVRIWTVRSKDLSPQPYSVPKQLGDARIGEVEQVPFTMQDEYGAYRAQRLEELGSYGWVDKEKGVVRMPIEQAIDELVRERKGKAP